jgi:hypothetical protein
LVISFKTAAAAVAPVHKQTYTIVCFRDAVGGRLREDTAATTRGKHDSSKWRWTPYSSRTRHRDKR